MAHTCSGTGASEWVIDSGASAHMCCQRAWFTSFQKLIPTQPVIIGDGRSILATGKGRIEMDMKLDNGRSSPTLLRDVYYVPDLDTNLMSVPALASKGLQVIFGEHGCKILAGDKVAALASKQKSQEHSIPLLPCPPSPPAPPCLKQPSRSGIDASGMQILKMSLNSKKKIWSQGWK